MSVSEQLDLFEEDEDVRTIAAEEKAAQRRKYRREHKADYRKFNGNVPTRGIPFVIVPEIAPILEQLANLAGKEASCSSEEEGVISGINILAARAAIVMGKPENSVVRRLYAIINKRQLFVNADFVESCLMAMDAEHEYQYGEWPSRREAALERVSIEAELAGKNLSPDKLLHKANRLYDKGIRKALKRAVEVKP